MTNLIIKELIKMQGVEIRELRKKAYLNQKALADKLGISQSYLSKLENGERNVNPELAKKIKEIFYERFRFEYKINQVVANDEARQQIILSLVKNQF